jgi:hypothetical protein
MVCVVLHVVAPPVAIIRLTSLNAQAHSTANLSEIFLSKYTFGGPKETLGYMWGVPQSHWIQQDALLKFVSHRLHVSDQLWIIILTSFVVVRSTSTASTDKVLTVFSEVSCDPPLQGHPGLLTNSRAANCKPKNAATLLLLDALRGPR